MAAPPGPPVDLNTPIKKIRLGEPKTELQRTLRIDTRVIFVLYV